MGWRGRTGGEVTELSSEEKERYQGEGLAAYGNRKEQGRKSSVWGPLVGRPEAHRVLLRSKGKAGGVVKIPKTMMVARV